MCHEPSLLIHAEDTVVLHSAPDDTILASTDRGQRTTDVHIQIGKLPAAEQGFLLWQHEQPALLTPHPEVVLIVLEQCPYIRGVQVDLCTLVIKSFQFALATWHPTEAVTHRSHKQIVVTVNHSHTEKLVAATHFRQVKIVVI